MFLSRNVNVLNMANARHWVIKCEARNKRRQEGRFLHTNIVQLMTAVFKLQVTLLGLPSSLLPLGLSFLAS